MKIEFPLIIKRDENDGSAEVLVDARIDEKMYRFLLDTGAAKSSVITDDYIRSYPKLGTKKANGVFASREDETIRLKNGQFHQ
jgi:hypothetical protein